MDGWLFEALRDSRALCKRQLQRLRAAFTRGPAEHDSGEGGAPRRPDRQLLAVLADRFNYASSECAARVLATNPGAKSAAALLTAARDSYMRNLCATKDKFVVVELCQDIRPDALILANYELFSSSVRRFRVSTARRYPPSGDEDGWRLLGDFETQGGSGSRRDQAFSLAGLNAGFVRYIRLDIISHHGHECYCPISSLRVYGKTMMEDFKDDDDQHHHSSSFVSSNLPAVIADNSPRVASSSAEIGELEASLEELRQQSRFECRVLAGQSTDTSERIDSLRERLARLKQEQARLSTTENIFQTIHSRLTRLEGSIQAAVDATRLGVIYRGLRELTALAAFGNPVTTPLLASKERHDGSVSDAESVYTSLVMRMRTDQLRLEGRLESQQFWVFILLIANLLLLLLWTVNVVRTRRQSSSMRASGVASSGASSRASSVADMRPTRLSFADKINSDPDLRRHPLTSLKSRSLPRANSAGSLSNQGIVLSDDELAPLLLSDVTLNRQNAL